jgi:cold shock CspA family protein
MSDEHHPTDLSYDSVLTNLNHTIQTNKRSVGQVRWFHPKKGFGMIRNIETNKDIFAHQTELKTENNVYRQLYPGEYVEYTEGTLSERISESESRSKVIAKIITGIGGNMLMCEYVAYTNASNANKPSTQEEIPTIYPKHQYKHMIPADVIRSQYSNGHSMNGHLINGHAINGVNEELLGAPLNAFNSHIDTVPDKLYNNYQQRKKSPSVQSQNAHSIQQANYIPLIQYPYPQSVIPMYISNGTIPPATFQKRNEYRPVKK